MLLCSNALSFYLCILISVVSFKTFSQKAQFEMVCHWVKWNRVQNQNRQKSNPYPSIILTWISPQSRFHPNMDFILTEFLSLPVFISLGKRWNQGRNRIEIEVILRVKSPKILNYGYLKVLKSNQGEIQDSKS